MPGTSLLALIDDISTVLDDVALMTKLAAKKTTGVLGDDLALNARQVVGVNADRELPVVWAVAKGSLKNKLILVPSALAISTLMPWAVTPLLMLGGAFLCYEGFEKLAHKLGHAVAEENTHRDDIAKALANPDIDMEAFEKDKIEGAIRTDFVLSAEIVTITLGSVATASFGAQVVVLAGIAILMTIGVYGVVAGIVKLDDGGLYLSRRSGDAFLFKIQRRIGSGVLLAAPYLMKGLSVAGTVAMFMVGGGILIHALPAARDLIHVLAHNAGGISGIGGALEAVTPTMLNVLAGLAAGIVTLTFVTAAKRVWQALKTVFKSEI